MNMTAVRKTSFEKSFTTILNTISKHKNQSIYTVSIYMYTVYPPQSLHVQMYIATSTEATEIKMNFY